MLTRPVRSGLTLSRKSQGLGSLPPRPSTRSEWNHLRTGPLVLLLVLLLAAAGCRKADDLPSRELVGPVEVTLPQAIADTLDLDADALAQLAMEALAETERFERIEPKAGAKPKVEEPTIWKLRVEVLFARVVPARSAGGSPLADAAVRLRLGRDAGDRLVAEGRGQRELSFEAGASNDLRRSLDEALEGAAAQLDAEIRAMSQTVEELIPDLDSPDPDRRDIAIRILAERQSVAAIPGLVALLGDEDRDRQLRVVGALVAIGDPSAAPALIEATMQRDPAFVIQIAYALAELGGDDAEAYLFTIANGHADAAVRRAGGEALRTLEKRRAAALGLDPAASSQQAAPDDRPRAQPATSEEPRQ